LLDAIEGNGWEVDEKGITRLVPANDLHFIVGDEEIVTDDEGIGTGKLAAGEITNARLLLAGQEIPKYKYDILADNKNIFVNIKFDVTDMSCEHGAVPIEGTGLRFSKGGTWDGDSMGRACLDDNGTGPAGFIGSDCDLAFVKDGCIIDHLYPDHGCYHHHSNRTCSVSIGHSQTWHTHGNPVQNVVSSIIKKIWPW
jgi:hypothetical protein